MSYRFLCLIVMLVLPCSQARSADPKPEPPYKSSTRWSGAWEISPEANQLLGFASEEDRANASFDHPLSFTLSFDETPGKSTQGPGVEGYEESVFEDVLKQRVVATGIWNMKFETDPGLDEESCFLTVKDGSTFLWKPAAYIVVYGGKISFIEGVDKSKDLLVIDFNPHESKLPRHETVVYRRASDKAKTDTQK